VTGHPISFPASWWAHRRTPVGGRGDDRERGSVSLFVVIVATGLLLLIGLIVDGGAKVRAIQRADVLAGEAARAGGQAVSVQALLGGQTPTVDPAAARTAALAYLAANTTTGTVTVSPDGRQVTVTVTITRPTVLLGLIGIGDLTATGSAVARPIRGPAQVAP
jgi:hypothetical protein